MYCQSEIYHTIQPNDTLYIISQRYQIPIDDIIRANPQVDFNYLIPGQTIKICFHRNISEVALNLMNTFRTLWEQHGARQEW